MNAAATRSTRLVPVLLRATWFGLVPSLLTTIVLRYLLPSPVRAPEGALHALSEWAEPRPVMLAIVFFMLFASLIRYWRALLPGAALWAEPNVAPSKAASGAGLTVGFLVFAGVAALFLRGSLFQSYRVLSGSMIPTLQPGEVLLSKQFAYGFHWPWSSSPSARAPKRGDVVVFHRRPERPDVPEELVKRVIGLPGDTISSFGGSISINGWRIPSCSVGPYVFISGDGMLEAQLRMEYLDDRVYLTAHAPVIPEHGPTYTVPPGEVFVVGDNRNNSSDSRAWNEGLGGSLRFGEIRGRAERFLFGQHRSGETDLSLLFKPVGVQVRGEGLDLSEIQEGIARCLKDRPKATHPPAPGASTP